jgi:NAD(P)-dependent dehydrogenase (short-subunit alcohol dehydrogenase family)
MDLRLKGRAALVTGASKGIGKAIAQGLAQEGVNLVILARGKDALDQAADQIRREQGVKVLALQADVREIAQVKAAADAAKAEFGTVHIVVNNAGSGIRRQDRQITWPDADWVDDLNLKLIGMLRVTQSFMPIMPRDWTGRIINISGIAGISAFIGALTHGLNNSAMNHSTSYLARDLAAEKITVNTVVPG